MVEAKNTDLKVGDIVDCTVEQIMPYGAFVRIIKTGRKGMIHISELSYNFVKDINEFLHIQDNIRAKIIKIDEKGRIDLSIKQTSEPPQTQARPQKFNNNNHSLVMLNIISAILSALCLAQKILRAIITVVIIIIQIE